MANSTVLVAAPPRETPFFDPRSGRISEPWLAWFGSITSTAAVVQNLQLLQIIAEDNSTDANTAAILSEVLDALTLLATPPRPPDPPETPAPEPEIGRLRAEVDELRAMIAALDPFPGAQVANMISQAAATTGNLTEATSDVLSISGGAGAVVGAGTSIQVLKATASQDGYLAKADWSTFNGKQAALGYTPLNPANNLSDVAAAATALANLVGAWQNWTSLAVSGTGSMTASGLTVTDAQYLVIGSVCHFKAKFTVTLGGTASFAVLVTTPVNGVGTMGATLINTNIGSLASWGYLNSASNFAVQLLAGGNYTLGSYTIWISGSYRCA